MSNEYDERFEAALRVLGGSTYDAKASYMRAVNPLVKRLKESLGHLSPAAFGLVRGEELDKLYEACEGWLKRFENE